MKVTDGQNGCNLLRVAQDFKREQCQKERYQIEREESNRFAYYVSGFYMIYLKKNQLSSPHFCPC